MNTKVKSYRFVVKISEDGGEVVPFHDNPRGPFEDAAVGELINAAEEVAKCLRWGSCDWAEIERDTDGVWRKTDRDQRLAEDAEARGNPVARALGL